MAEATSSSCCSVRVCWADQPEPWLLPLSVALEDAAKLCSPPLQVGEFVLHVSVQRAATASVSSETDAKAQKAGSFNVEDCREVTMSTAQPSAQNDGRLPLPLLSHGRGNSAEGASAPPPKKQTGFDLKLIVLILLWYLGNWYHNVTNKVALKAGGGPTGYPLTIATGYLGVGSVYALFLWAAPDARPLPQITMHDYLRTLPVGLATAGAHLSACFAVSGGSLSFVQIVKAMEPVFAAVIGLLAYSTKVSAARWFCMIPIIGGVVLASMGELSFAWSSLFLVSVANAFAAVKGNENKRLMLTAGLKDRIGSVGNQFAITTINSFLFCLVVMVICEGHKFWSFMELIRSGGNGTIVLNNMIASGLWFYFFNELATITIDKTGAVTQSVLNTAKRAFVMIGAAILLKEDLGTVKLIGSVVSIGGVFLYSNIDHWTSK